MIYIATIIEMYIHIVQLIPSWYDIYTYNYRNDADLLALSAAWKMNATRKYSTEVV